MSGMSSATDVWDPGSTSDALPHGAKTLTLLLSWLNRWRGAKAVHRPERGFGRPSWVKHQRVLENPIKGRRPQGSGAGCQTTTLTYVSEREHFKL